MAKQCRWQRNTPQECEKPGVCSIDWPDDTVWLCAEHYDRMIASLKKSGRIAILKGQYA